MHTGTRLLLAFFCVLLSGCGGDDDCYRERRCESIGGDLTCVWVKVCPDRPDEVLSSRVAASVAPLPEGERWDLRVGAGETSEDGLSPLVANLLGAEVARRTGAHGYRQWWFHAWPADWVRAAAREASAADIQRLQRSPDPQDACSSCCDALALIHTDALPPVPERVAKGEVILLHAPAANDLAPSSGYLGLVVYLTPPGDGPTRARLLTEGESASVSLEKPGRWTLRVALLSEDLCEFGVADALVVQTVEIEVEIQIQIED